jgi:hypothetical protein
VAQQQAAIDVALQVNSGEMIPAGERIERAAAGDREVAREIHLDERRQARRAEQAADRGGRADTDTDVVARLGAERHDLAVPQLDRAICA